LNKALLWRSPQLSAFVLVARLGSVTSAANALGVSGVRGLAGLTALRQHLVTSWLPAGLSA
jgi:DNA-binding transcriptional LysR family regulator